LTDISEERLQEANATYKKDISTYALCDVSNSRSIADAYETACLEFGGVDIIIHSAGLAISKSLTDTTLKDWDLLQNVLVKGQFNLAKEGVDVLRKQGLGGDIIHIASKNGLVAGPNNVGYGTAKGAKANGITVEELPAFYAKRNLMNEIIRPEDIANGVFALVALLDKSTGNIINVDGGMANAFVR